MRRPPAGPSSPLPVSPGPPLYRCVECSHPVASLYTIYSKDNVRLTQCVAPPHHPPLTAQDKCKKFADKYIEHDFVVLFIDIILIKPQVYRHLLYNRLGTADDRLNVRSLNPLPSTTLLMCVAVDFTIGVTFDIIRRLFDMGTCRKVLVKLYPPPTSPSQISLLNAFQRRHSRKIIQRDKHRSD
jgi:Arv1-like family